MTDLEPFGWPPKIEECGCVRVNGSITRENMVCDEHIREYDAIVKFLASSEGKARISEVRKEVGLE